ncbi:MAG: addiction module protein [Bacteroidetes bacterium]|nr:addiction module protein [Bacteroidota bacterium]
MGKRKEVNLLEMNINMGAVKSLIKEITHYLGNLNAEQQKAVLGVVKTFAQEDAWWNDKSYIAEMDRRFAEMESGGVKSITLDELEAGAKRGYKNRKRQKQ